MSEKSHLSFKFTQLEKAKQRPQNQVPKIQKVAHHIRDREHFAKHYSPKLVSIGPIHHGTVHLHLGERYKLMWAAMYLERTQQDAQTLYQKIASKINQFKELFDKDVIGDFPDDEELSWMLFVDGCALLQILEKGHFDMTEEMKIKVDQLVLVLQDVLLLENQLPYEVLKLLSGHDNDAMLVENMKEFLKCHHLSPERPDRRPKDVDRDEGYTRIQVKDEQKVEMEGEPVPFHLLDQLRRVVLHNPPNKKTRTRCKEGKQETKKGMDVITYRNIQELKASGIRLRTTKSRKLSNFCFSSGWLGAELKLPEIVVDDTTAPTFLNLMAYEMSNDFKNKYEICSFVAFMDSLIDHPDDVKELRQAGVLHNALGSDEEVAKLFNTISTDLVPDTDKYADLRFQIERHYRNKCKTWMALAYYTYFSTPWAIIAFHAAVVALVLTFIQTWFAINPAC